LFKGENVRVLINVSPLILLAKADLLDVLKRLFGKVWTSRIVWNEVMWPLRHGIRARNAEILRNCGWIEIVDLTESETRMLNSVMLRFGVDPGEASLVVLYRRGFNLIIMADRDAEETLRNGGFNIMDLSELVVLAAKKGLVNAREAARRIWNAGYMTEEIERIMLGQAP